MFKIRTFLFLSILVSYSTTISQEESFFKKFSNTPDRVWIGPEFWSNPMEDWKIENGKLMCLVGGWNRNVHLLTAALEKNSGSFEISVDIELIDKGKTNGSAGFRIGIYDEIDDYRARALRGRGFNIGITTDGLMFIGKRKSKKIGKPFLSGKLVLKGEEDGKGKYILSLFLKTLEGNKTIESIVARDIPSDWVFGPIALVNNHPGIFKVKKKNGPCFTFDNIKIKGTKLKLYPERKFGPILFVMHTLNNSGTSLGYIMKMTAQFPPLGRDEPKTAFLEIKSENTWKEVAEAKIDPSSWTATFKITDWPGEKDISYRVFYKTKDKEGKQYKYYYYGKVRKDPKDEPLVVGAFTGNYDVTFPHLEIHEKVKNLDPHMLFFSGDQIYEPVGGYGVIRRPAKRSILNYLRKWFLFGWAFGDLMKDRVTVCLPDDHDVYQGNLWGEGGKDCHGIINHPSGGYAQPVEMVNVVHRTQTSNLPDPYDPTPIKRGITVYYTSLVYGRVSFAVIADRMFKSGPQGKVNTWKGRPDHVKDPNIDIKALDKPGLKLLGDRQIKFLKEWITDWKGADLKVVLSQTIFCNLANYHGGYKTFIIADLDSNGWPQSRRNLAIDIIRRGFAFHLAGDQHLASIVRYGISDFDDACFAFCVPSIANFYPRYWLPEKEGRKCYGNVDPDLPNTGKYFDGLGNRVTVYAVANPKWNWSKKGRLISTAEKASGFGIVRFNQKAQTIKIECWKMLENTQFKGWPRTISILDNYGRKPKYWLPEIKVEGSDNFVLKIIDQKTGEIEYSLRLRRSSFVPKVFKKSIYTVIVGIPEKGKWKLFDNVKPEKDQKKTIIVKFR